MVKRRFLGDEPHDVRDLGRTVEPDELVDIPDDLDKERAWPESLWSEPQKSTAAKDKG